MIKSRSGPERIRLFRSERLERLTVISPQAFAIMWACILALILFSAWGEASVAASVGIVLAGLLVWSLTEYLMHRILFHMNMRSKFGRYVIFVMHGNHHAEPNDPDRNMMPPIISIPYSAAIWALFLLLLGPKGSLLFLGFTMGYVIYDSVHYACHQLPMRGPVFGPLRKHHIRHHHAKRDGNFAITSVFWDRLFGTNIPMKG